MDAQPLIILDASVLINYIHVHRLDLIAGCWAEVRVIEQVQQELQYADQKAVFEEAIRSGLLKLCAIDEPELLDEALRVNQIERRGKGESYSFVYAKANGIALAIDDQKARALFATKSSSLLMLTSKDLMVFAIRRGLITVEEADAIKEVWSLKCRYRLKISSFAELLS
jgi:predicted nucleic acid-binding protein